MKTSDFDYELPADKIAQTPIAKRDESRLMVLSRAEQRIEHCSFYEIGDFMRKGDVLVFNDSRVIPARLWGNRDTGGKVELLLLRHLDIGTWESLLKPAKRVAIGDRLRIFGRGEQSTWAEVIEKQGGGVAVIRVTDDALLEDLGEVPLPPYIHAPLKDPERYQTVYAKVKGSVAAPTAGLHFTPRLLEALNEKGIDLAFVTLHVGLDTFRPVREEDPHQHRMHREYGEIGQETARGLNIARAEGRRIVCVGTTVVRLLEAAALAEGSGGMMKPLKGWTNLFILPGFHFQVANAMITNFHLSRSTLLMLVSAFGGKELIRRAYEEAKVSDYRFYSFGDAMLIL